MSDLAVFKMTFDCGRSGELEGVFIESKAKVKYLIDKGIKVYFGEVLGKHSEVYGSITESEIELVSDEPEAIKWCTPSGYDPFQYTTIETGRDDFDDLTTGEVIDILMEEDKLK